MVPPPGVPPRRSMTVFVVGPGGHGECSRARLLRWPRCSRPRGWFPGWERAECRFSCGAGPQRGMDEVADDDRPGRLRMASARTRVYGALICGMAVLVACSSSRDVAEKTDKGGSDETALQTPASPAGAKAVVAAAPTA